MTDGSLNRHLRPYFSPDLTRGHDPPVRRGDGPGSVPERAAAPVRPAYAFTAAGSSFRISETNAFASPNSISVLSM